MFDEKAAILTVCRALEHSSIGLAVIDPAGRFVLTNKAYRRITGCTAEELASTGCTFTAHPGDLIENQRLAGRFAAGEIDNSAYETRYIRRNGDVIRVRMSVSIVRNGDGEIVNAIALAEDITARKRTDERLQQLQAAEQKRIARELHDNTAQLLAGLKMNLSIVKDEAALLSPRALRAMTESVALTDRCLREIRTSAYLLRPPELECGLRQGLVEYVAGYEQRSGIRVDLALPPDLGSLPREVESALFQIVREALTNIFRHSRSATAGIRLDRDPSRVTLEVADAGKGMRLKARKNGAVASLVPGIGITSMRERASQLGGALDIHSNGCGTTVRVVLPLLSGEHG